MPVLYNLTLQKPTAIVQAIYGNFSAPRAQEIVTSRGKVLELLRCDDQGKLLSILSTEVFGLIRSIATFRLTGATRDYIVIGSDSGRLTILNYDDEKNVFEKVHCETYGKSGIRRVIAGEYIGVDPKGRALIIGAIERQKFVYVLNRDANAKLTISSPLEAHKSHMICHALTGIDVGFENPVFTSLEQSYEEIDTNHDSEAELPPKGVSWWEMDLGLNHVIKKATFPVDITAHALIPVPGGGGVDGPSGVLVCCENYLVYKKPDHEDIYCAVPRRLEMGQDKGLMIIAFAVHRMKHFFFILIQSEFGDIYKVELTHEEGIVREIQCRYFDTIPVANSLCVLKSGYLFAAMEFGNHLFYQFTGIGTDETDPLCTSAHPHGKNAIMAFKPKALRNLVLSDEIQSLAPITDMIINNHSLHDGVSQIYALCGRGPRSSFRILQHGLGVEEMADNELPGNPKAVWTIKHRHEDVNDGYIIVSFEGSTLVLSIGDTVEEVTETLFLTSVTSIHIALFVDDSVIQVHENGIRHIAGKRVNEWKAPAGKRIRAATSNDRQLVISLSGGDLVQFEVDESHALNEIAEKSLNVEITCMAIQPTPQGRLRGSFVAVGGLDNIVRILSLDREKSLRQLATQLLPNNATPESVCLLQMEGLGETESSSSLFLSVGLNTGVMLRSMVDPITGQLCDQRSRFLGCRSVHLRLVRLCNMPAMLALSEKTWVCYSFHGKYNCIPLNYDTLEYASSFCSEQCSDGFVAISQNSLRIFRCQRLGEIFSQQIIPLSYTPRKLALLPSIHSKNFLNGIAHDVGKNASSSSMLAIIESDHNAYDENTKNEIRNALKGIKLNLDDEDEDIGDQNEKKEEEEELSEEQIGTFKAGAGKWGSCLRIINPILATTIEKRSMDLDEAALSLCVCELDGIKCIVIGTAVNMTFSPRKIPSAFIKVFTYDSDFRLQLLHSTQVDGYPMCLAAFNGKLLASIGKCVRIYSLGKKKLLRKCEYKNFPEGIMWMKVIGDRIYAADIRESFHVLKYREEENVLHVLCDDVTSRWISSAEILDYHTVIGADKFDSVFVVRVPSEAKQDEIDDVSGLRLRGDTSYLTGKCNKFEHACEYHVGEIVTAITKTKLSSGSSECVFYSTIMGSIGAFLPFLSKEELDFFHHLEMIMRNEKPPLCGREHIMFRSYYRPVKHVVDGDLCEEFVTLPLETQKRIAQDLDKPPAEIMKKLEDIRNRIL